VIVVGKKKKKKGREREGSSMLLSQVVVVFPRVDSVEERPVTPCKALGSLRGSVDPERERRREKVSESSRENRSVETKAHLPNCSENVPPSPSKVFPMVKKPSAQSSSFLMMSSKTPSMESRV